MQRDGILDEGRARLSFKGGPLPFDPGRHRIDILRQSLRQRRNDQRAEREPPQVVPLGRQSEIMLFDVQCPSRGHGGPRGCRRCPANLEAYKDVKVQKKAKEPIEAALASIQ
ncbi:hypothetical protein C0075_05350 [Rhizobium sp. KAs_5_22]|nr:hypothetical protein C0075_05350 [Rhizobium sp. KAs_5_22]